MKITKSKVTIIIIYLVLAFLYTLPQLFTSYPNLTDDGSYYSESQLPVQDVVSVTIENERTRPVGFLYRKLLYSVFGPHVAFHFAAYAVLLAVTLIVINAVLFQLTKKRIVSLIIPIVLMIFPYFTENYYRLGTEEPLQVFLIVASVLLFNSSRVSIGVLFFILSLFVKETSVFYVFAASLFLFFKKNKNGFYLLLASALYSCFIIYKLHRGGEYIHLAPFTFQSYIEHFIRYFHIAPEIYIFFGISVISVLCFWRVFQRDNKIILLLFLSFFGFIPSFIWGFYDYYYWLTQFIVVAILIVAVSWKLYFIKKRNKMYASLCIIFITLIFALTIYSKMGQSIKSALYWHSEYIYNSPLVEYLLNTDFQALPVFSAEGEFEPNQKIYLYASKLEKKRILFYPRMKDWFNEVNDERNLKRLTTYAVRQYYAYPLHAILIVPGQNDSICPHGSKVEFCSSSPFIVTRCKYYACIK